LTKTTIKLLALIVLTLMILATAPSFAAANPEWQAHPMYKVKAQEVDPYSLGANHPYYAPLDIHEAYNIPETSDSGTIALIEAYDNPRVAADLATFSTVFTWPTATIEVHKMSSTILPNAGWALESDLDVQWAHAVAPHANLLVVEAKSASIVDLMAAVDYANTRSDVVAISMSWGSTETSGQLAYDSHFNTNGKTYFASAGDAGGVVSWPSSSPNVVSVGGTTLTMTTTGYTETAWSSGGGGVSTIETQPTYQKGVTDSYSLSKRATPDVSYNADPNTGFLVYDSYGYNGGRGWFAVGGTSAGAPQWAAIDTFGNTATNTNFYANYQYGTTFSDIVGGSNGYPAGPGYDLATGLGSPITTNFARQTGPDFSISASPNPVVIKTGTTGNPGTATITVTPLNGYTGTVKLSAAQSALTMNFDNTQITGSGTSTLTITVPQVTPAGNIPITITGTDGKLTHTTTLIVQVVNPDYSISVSPTPIAINSGATGTSTVTLNPTSTYPVTAQLSYTATGGLTAAFNPTSVTASSPSTVTITVPINTATGTYTVTIQGADGTNVHTTTLSVQVTKPDFAISASPTSQTIKSGSSGQATITVTPNSAFTGTVTFSSNKPSGWTTPTFSPTSITTSGSSTMTITVPSNARSGTYTFTITGTSGTLTHTTTVVVTVSTSRFG
jgi:subtilase family serine protease